MYVYAVGDGAGSIYDPHSNAGTSGATFNSREVIGPALVQSAMKKLIFLIAFTVGHAFLTLLMLDWGWGPRFAGTLFARVYNSVVTVFMCPIVLPLMRLDPDGDRTPRWLQWASYFLNSLIWAVVVLLLFVAVKRLFGNRTIRRVA